MTDIDLKRLAGDREYWDSVAPLGATHYWPPSGDWYQDCGDFAVAWMSGAENWGHGFATFRISRPEIIPRPAKKVQEVEWDGEAFPIPSGAKCEVQMGSFWYPGTVIASTAEAAWFKSDHGGDFWTIMNGLSIRPRTKEQRQKDELIELIGKQRPTISELADAILSRYTLEPRQ